MKLIICEDDPIQVIDLAEIVSACGGDISGTFRCGQTALAAARVLSPDMALVDPKLADGETGADLARDLTLLGCRVVIISGSARPHASLGCIPHTYISKPVNAAVVNELIRTAKPSAGITESTAGETTTPPPV